MIFAPLTPWTGRPFPEDLPFAKGLFLKALFLDVVSIRIPLSHGMSRHRRFHTAWTQLKHGQGVWARLSPGRIGACTARPVSHTWAGHQAFPRWYFEHARRKRMLPTAAPVVLRIQSPIEGVRTGRKTWANSRLPLTTSAIRIE